jgi:EcsC protein family
MPRRGTPGKLAERLQGVLVGGFSRAFARVRVDPDHYLRHLQRTYDLPIRSFSDMHHMPVNTIDGLADHAIATSVRFATLEGAGLGMGGMLTIVPDMGILAAVVVRLIQKLSLLYGFEYNTDEETAALWMAAAAAAGVDLGKDFLEKQALERLVPRIIERIAARMSAEVAEKLAGRIIPILSGLIGAMLNHYFVREIGRRAKVHFREKHRLARHGRTLPDAVSSDSEIDD